MKKQATANEVANIAETPNGWTIYPPDAASAIGGFPTEIDAIRVALHNGWAVESFADPENGEDNSLFEHYRVKGDNCAIPGALVPAIAIALVTLGLFAIFINGCQP